MSDAAPLDQAALVARVRALEALVERVVRYTDRLIIDHLEDWPDTWDALKAECGALVPVLRDEGED